MPVPLIHFAMWLEDRKNAHDQQLTNLLRRIVANIRATRRDYTLSNKKVRLLCKAVLGAFDVNNKLFSLNEVYKFFHRTGEPRCLNEETLYYDPAFYDGIGNVTVVYWTGEAYKLIFILTRKHGKRVFTFRNFSV